MDLSERTFKKWRPNKSYLLIAFLVSVVGGWFLFGASSHKKKLVLTTQHQQAESSSSSPLQKVRTQNFLAAVYPISVHLSGQTMASQTDEISSQLDGRIEKIITPKGKFVSQGTPLIQLKAQDFFHKRDTAKAQLKLREMQLNTVSKLYAKNYSSPISLAQANANFEEANQALKKAQLDCDRLIIRAPFDGVVNHYSVEENGAVSIAKTLGQFVNLNPLRVKVFINEQTFQHVRQGQKAEVLLSNQQTIQGVVSFLSVIADDATKTFKMEIAIPNPRYELPVGMTATVKLELKDQKLHKISPAYLTLSEAGTLGAKTLTFGKAKFMPVKVVDSTADHVLVAGLPPEVTLITLGQETVKDGESVTPVFEDTLSEPPHA
ncbi:MAG: efflux RND transporter periplasmic adaptor subunit [Alphaproteobacteria bacterium]